MARKKTSVEEVFTPEVEDVSVVEEVSEPVVEKVEAEVLQTGVVTARMLNIRRTPSKDFEPIGTLSIGTKVKYFVENDEWLKLENGGFVAREFVK